MKTLYAIFCLAVFAFAQTGTPHSGTRITAQRYTTTGQLAHLEGVVIETDSILLQADTADVNPATEEITAHGDVRIRMK